MQVSCSFDYLTRSASNLSYNYCLMTCEFVAPVTVMVVCYVGIVLAVRRQADELRDIQSSLGARQQPGKGADNDDLNRTERERAEQRKQEYRIARVRLRRSCHHRTIRYDTIRDATLNVRSKADMSRLNLPHENDK